MEISFAFVNQTDTDLTEYETLFSQIIETALTILHIDDDVELSCIIVDNNAIWQINRDYRQIDRPTDVISFALEDQPDVSPEGMPRELGDIFISLEKASEQAESYGHSFHREFCFLFTHGLLHLLGYDHMEKQEAEVMFGLQEEILNAQKITR